MSELALWEIVGMAAAVAFGVLLLTAGLVPALAGVAAVALSGAITKALP